MGTRTHQMKNARGQAPSDAPGFVLPRSEGGPSVVYEPQDHVDDGCVVLVFVAVEHLEWTSFLDWFACHDSVDVFIIANSSQRDLRPDEQVRARHVPILADANEHVASDYGVDYRVDDPSTIILVDSDGRIRQAWKGASDPSTVYESVRAHSIEPRPVEIRGVHHE